MPYKNVVQALKSLGPQDRQQVIREFDNIRAELDDIREKYTALQALLVAGTAPGVAYDVGTDLGAQRFTPT